MEGVEWVVREGVGAGGRNDPYAHMNNKTIKKEKKFFLVVSLGITVHMFS
jgi:hypothetical protein